MKRRQFLKSSAAGAIALASGVGCKSSWLIEDRSLIKSTAPESAESILIRIKDSALADNLGPALLKLLGPLGGIETFVKKGQTVLLKPNLAFNKPAHLIVQYAPEIESIYNVEFYKYK